MKKRGKIEYIAAYMIICFTGLLMLFSFSVKEVRQNEIFIKDGLDSACLAAALIDLEDYAKDRFIFIPNYEYNRQIFLNALKENLNLNNDYTPKEKALFDRITVHEFIIYNIADGELYTYRYSDGKMPVLKTEGYDKNKRTPDGTLIESSTIYADIGMNVTSFAGVTKYVHVKSSVDVVNN
ncbi:MAG: hypothetical protein E7267_03720 [Lachnospiraceae bacterium]|nr:hypothetical protein [Lachnospiraceae bacterium]